MNAAPNRSLADDHGSILPLTVFYAGLGLVLILLVVAATSMYLEHKRLLTLADGAALAAAEAFPLDAIELDGTSPKARLTSPDVRDAADDYLSSAAAAHFDQLKLVEADSPDGTSATVRVSAVWHPPILSLLLPEGITLQAGSVARSVFW